MRLRAGGCGSRAAVKLQWLQVVADAMRLRLARRCMADAGTSAVRLTQVLALYDRRCRSAADAGAVLLTLALYG